MLSSFNSGLSNFKSVSERSYPSTTDIACTEKNKSNEKEDTNRKLYPTRKVFNNTRAVRKVKNESER